MERIRAYLLFTSWRYRLGIFLGLPAAVLAGGLLWHGFLLVSVFSYLMITGMIFAETITDRWIFNGIQSKRGYKLDFLKTSPAGPRFLFQGLSGDLVRRLLMAMVCIGIGWAIRVLDTEDGWAGYLGLVLTVYFSEMLGLFLSRFTRSIILFMFVAYGSITVGNILYVLLGNISASGLWAADGLLALAAAAMSVLIVRTGMRKWRNTYSDAQE